VCEAFQYLGLELDTQRNNRVQTDDDVAAASSGVRVLVIAAREDLSVLRGVRRALGW
jgi:acetate kinase